MVKVTDSNGETSLKPGVVDYVIFEGGEPYLVINEEKYPYADLDTVLSDDYLKRMENYELASAVVSYIDDLPDPADATLDVYNKVTVAKGAYDSLTDEQKALISEEHKKKLDELVELMEKLSGLNKGEESEK